MKCPWLGVATVVLLLGGCTPQREPAAKPVTETANKGPVSRFNLPLVIHIDVPETPPEIEKPSAPIQQPPAKIPNPSPPIQDKSHSP